MNTKKNFGLILTVIGLIIIVGAVIWALNSPSGDKWQTYTEEDFGFSIQYPSDWVMRDDLTTETCCLFVAHWTTSTSTMPATTTEMAKDATTTPMKTVVTQKELVKLQIGYYDRSISDPFQAATTTPVKLNGKTYYTGITSNGQYYLLPRNDNEGVGLALFRYTETPEADLVTAEKVIGSITLLKKPASAVIATSTPKTATSTKAASTTSKK